MIENSALIIASVKGIVETFLFIAIVSACLEKDYPLATFLRALAIWVRM